MMASVRSRWFAVLAIWGLALLVAIPATASISQESVSTFNALSIDAQLKIHGVIDKIQGNVLFAKTPWGRYAIGTTKKFRHLAVGDEVILYVNGDNAVVDVQRKGAPRPRHRWLTGHLHYTSPAKDEIRLWTPEGMQSFKVNPPVIGRLNAIPEGSSVTVEIDEEGRVIDIEKLTVLLNIDKPYSVEKGGYMEVSGIVTQVEGPLVFVETPVGQMTIASVMKAKEVRPGETVVLRLDENYTVVDVHKPRTEHIAHRYLTGKLAYTDKAQSAIRLETPEGIKVFPLSVSQQAQLASVKKGEYVTVELDKNGHVVKVYKAIGQG